MPSKPHSAEYFGETRDLWWNTDFLQLMSRRWNLAEVKTVLDVGCGIGHWGRCLEPLLPADATITGIDREPRWIEEARKRAGASREGRLVYHISDAETLPFPDNTFDFVTCQTVLIHVRDPLQVLAEMRRVVKPSGLIAVVEPHNTTINLSNLDLRGPPDDIIEVLRFQMICERGKMNLGEGFNSAGAMVAGWFSEIGIDRISVCLSDKAYPFLPPYSSRGEKLLIQEATEWIQRDFWIWSKDDTYRYYIAGNGVPNDFPAAWQKALAQRAEFLKAIERGELNVTWATPCYIVSGRKPDA
jgi:SAM-dependent methyltransferase